MDFMNEVRMEDHEDPKERTSGRGPKPTPSAGAWKGFAIALPFGLLSWALILLLLLRTC